MILSLSYSNILKSTSAAAVPLYLGANSKSFTKWVGVAAELSYNPHLRNGWVTVDTGVKGRAGSPLIEFSTWEASNSLYNITIPNSFAFKFLVSADSVSAQFLARSSVEARELWVGNLFESSVVNSWDTRSLSSAAKRGAAAFQRAAIFYVSQRWSPLLFSRDLLDAVCILPTTLGRSVGLVTHDFFYRDLTSNFLFARKAVKHRQYRVRFELYDSTRFSGVSCSENLTSLTSVKFIRALFFKSLVRKFYALHVMRNNLGAANFDGSGRAAVNRTFRCLLIKLNVLVLTLSELGAGVRVGSVWNKLLSDVVADLAEIYAGADGTTFFRSSICQYGLISYLTTKISRLMSITSLSGVALFTLIVFVVKTFSNLFRNSVGLSNIAALQLYSYKFCQLRVKSVLTSAHSHVANSVFLSSHVSSANFLATYSCHRGNRLRAASNSRRFRVRRSSQFFRRRRNRFGLVGPRAISDGGVKLFFKKRWKRLLKYFKVSSSGAQFNFVFFWSFNFFNFTNLKVGYRKFFYLSVRVIYFFRQFLKFFKFYTFYFQLLRALEFTGEALFSGARVVFNNVKLFSLLLFRKFGRVVWSFNSFCLKLFALRWKKLSTDLLGGLRQARGIILKTTVFGPLNFSALSYSSTSTSIRVISNTYRQLLSKNFNRGLGKAKTVRSYLRYLLHLRQQISGVWENKLLVGLLQLGGGLLTGAFASITLPADVVFKRLFLAERFRMSGRNWKLRVSRLARELMFDCPNSKRLQVFGKLLARLRARRIFALRCLKREAYNLLKSRLLAAGSRKYLTFIGAVTAASCGKLGAFSRNDLRVATLLAVRPTSNSIKLSYAKQLLLASKQSEVVHEFAGADTEFGAYCSDRFYSLAESFQLALANCGRARVSVLFENSMEVAISVALVSLTRVLSINSVGGAWGFLGSHSAIWGARLRNNKSFLFCSAASGRKALLVSSAACLKPRFDFFEQFGLQYYRVRAGSFVRNDSGVLKANLLARPNFGDLNWSVAGTSFAFITNIFGGLSFFLTSLFSLTLLSRFLRANFFVGISFGLNQQLYSRLFWRKNIGAVSNGAGLGSFSRLAYFKHYLGRTASFFQFSRLSFLQNLVATNSLSAERGGLVNQVTNYTEYAACPSKEGGYSQEDHVLFSCGVDHTNVLKSFNLNSTPLLGVSRFNRRLFPFFFYGRAGKRVRRSLRVAKKLFNPSHRWGAKYYVPVKFCNRLVHADSVGVSSLLSGHLKHLCSSAYSWDLRGAVGRHASFLIAARRARTLNAPKLLGVAHPTYTFTPGGGYSMAFLKRLLGVAGLAFFRASRANRSFKLSCQAYLQDSRQFLAGVRGIRPLKLFAHAKRIGLWPKNLKLRPVKARQKQPSFKLVTYRHSRAALLKSNKVKLPPSIFSKENYESMNLVWDFPHQNYKFARVNSFQRMRAWRHIRRQMIRRLFGVVFKKLRIKSYKRAFRYRKYLRKRWFRMKLKRRVLRGFVRAASKLASVTALRRIYVLGNVVKSLNGRMFINHSTRLTYALVLKTFVISLYAKFGYLRTLSKAYFLKTTKLQFLFLVLRGFFLKMVTFFSSYVFIQKVVFNEFLSKTHLFARFGDFLLGLGSISISGITNSCVLGCDRVYSRLLGAIAGAHSSGFALAPTYLISRGACKGSKAPCFTGDFRSGFTRILGILLQNPVPLSWSFNGGDSEISLVNELFETVGFQVVRFTRRRTRQPLKNIMLLRANVFSKPSRSVQALRIAARRGLVRRSRAHLKLRLQKLLKSWGAGRVSLAGIGAGLRTKTVQSVRLRWIYLQLFWYLKQVGHYVNLARILNTASRIVKNRRHRFLLTSGVNTLKSYSNPIWVNARKKRALTSLVGYWRRKKIRRRARLRRRVGRAVLPVPASLLVLKKKRRRGASSSLFWNRRLHVLRRKAFFVNNFGVSSRKKTGVSTRFPFFGNLNLKGSLATSTGLIREGRALKFYSKRRIFANNLTRAFLLRRFKSGPRILTRRARANKKRTKSFHFTKVVKQEIKPKRLLRFNTPKFFRRARL